MFPAAQAAAHPLEIVAAVIGVLMWPGLTELTRIGGDSLPHSAAQFLVSWSTAALEELYAALCKP
jgi:hypothetical protein